MTAIRQRDQRIAAVRGFNRFYTRQIGVLRKTFLDSPYSLGEARVLYELASGRAASARDARQSVLTLTARGRNTYAPLERRSQRDTGAMLDKLQPAEQARLIA